MEVTSASRMTLDTMKRDLELDDEYMLSMQCIGDGHGFLGDVAIVTITRSEWEVRIVVKTFDMPG